MCACHTAIEDDEHFFLECPLYEELRTWIRDTQGWDIFTMDVEELLYGSNNLSDGKNKLLFEIVQLYIELTKRFDHA